MGSLGNTPTWVPYITSKDCSQGICSIYCPKLCYNVIFPPSPPPPPPFTFPEKDSYLSFPPLVIAIIGILASTLLVVTYYLIISKFCGKSMDSSIRRENREPDEELEEFHDPTTHGPWVIETAGLDETLIKSIKVFTYKKIDGSIHGLNCSVCLNEFQEDEGLKLLPKCSHAFHVTCIDTWLKGHTNCPLCRANIVFVNSSRSHSENVDFAKDIERGVREEEIALGNMKRLPLRALCDSNKSGELNTDQRVRRSVSMDNLCQRRVWDSEMEEGRLQSEVGSSKGVQSETSKFSFGNTAMKRSFSSGRFLFTKHGVGRNSAIPL